MRFYKANMSSGEPICLTEEQAKNLIISKEQMVVVNNSDKTFSYLNKAHIVSILPDKEANHSQIMIEQGEEWDRQHSDYLLNNKN